MKKHWYDYLWIFSSVYLVLGFFNILFAWLGLICFITPLLISIIGGSKAYCNKYCGRGQLFEQLGGKLGLSRKKSPPRFLRSKWFRHGFLTFFMAMFLLMIYNTYLVFAGATLKEAVTLLWVFKLPWKWTNTSFVSPWTAQFAFGFYGVMLTSTVLGLVTMILFKPRSWCVYCPMGSMTQGICKIKHRKSACGEANRTEASSESKFQSREQSSCNKKGDFENGRKSETNCGAAENACKREPADDLLRPDGEADDSERNCEMCAEYHTVGAVTASDTAKSTRNS